MILTVRVCPACPETVPSEMLAEGSIVSVEVFLLLKAVPVVVTPETLTRYALGVVRTTEEGTVKLTCAVAPAIRVKADAVVETLGPAPEVAGARDTVILLADIAAVGKPPPVTRTSCTFGSAACGSVEAAKVTCADARPAAQNRVTNRIAEISAAALLLAASATLRNILKIELDMITNLTIPSFL